jgi:hypothetical protein
VPETGLAVTAPPGYQAKAAPARGRYTAIIDVKRANERDTGCKIAFSPSPQNRRLTQTEINTLVDTPERRAVIEGTLGTLYQITAVDQFEQGGVRGSVATATFKALPGIPARASEMINLFYLLETPKGRTTIVCLSEQQTFSARKSEFDSLARSVTLPR